MEYYTNEDLIILEKLKDKYITKLNEWIKENKPVVLIEEFEKLKNGEIKTIRQKYENIRKENEVNRIKEIMDVEDWYTKSIKSTKEEVNIENIYDKLNTLRFKLNNYKRDVDNELHYKYQNHLNFWIPTIINNTEEFNNIISEIRKLENIINSNEITSAKSSITTLINERDLQINNIGRKYNEESKKLQKLENTEVNSNKRYIELRNIVNDYEKLKNEFEYNLKSDWKDELPKIKNI